MSEKQEPQKSDAECSAVEFQEFEDEERWLFKVLGIKPRPSSAVGTNTDKKEEESLGHAEFLRLQDILQENKVSITAENNTYQPGYVEDDNETNHSDSDVDDNVNVIIGKINTNPSKYMEMLTNLNLKADRNLEASSSDNTLNPAD
ncbi:testis-specific protein TSX-like [Meriones unguiculatus]|uniref:testis-specific protein TSX-like n=1 Tax=Meriones unguiculatus TaxID=10047 RepID=UPI00293E4673|nr:testis-specific protein TSX-like [Meriones unguiculatus]